MKTIVNFPRKKWIGRGWMIITLLFAVFFAWIFGMASPEMSYWEMVFFVSICGFVIVLLVATTFAYYRTKYVIRNGVLHSWSPFTVINLPLKDIRSVERTRVPCHLRVGASDYCGFFWIPGVGWTRTIMTNVTDGVLIYAKDGRKYLITPSEPDKFARLLKR